MTIDSSLLYTKGDGTQDFVHDSYRDFFLAIALAKRINEDEISIHDACLINCPVIPMLLLDCIDDYQTDRIILPEWQKVWDFIMPYLRPEKARELVDMVWEHFEYGAFSRTREQYNQYFAYLDWCAKLIRSNSQFSKDVYGWWSYYLIKAFEEIYRGPNEREYTPSFPEIAVRAHSLDEAKEKADKIFQRKLDLNKKHFLPGLFLAHVEKITNAEGGILYKHQLIQ